MKPLPFRVLPRMLFIGPLLLTLSADSAQACVGKAVPPSCGRTVVVTTAVPRTLVATGGSFDVATQVYLGLAEFPAGSGLCPPGPFEVDVELAITCTPTGDGGGSVLDVTIEQGYTMLDVPVTLPAGVPRICTVSASAEVLFGDGSIVTATNDRAQICLVEESAADPGLPRLDLELVAGDPLAGVHPGDQSAHVWRLTNRDPGATFDGELEVETENQSRVPSAIGIGSFVDGVFSPSNPELGDNFPIAFADTVATCVPLPPDPLDPTVPRITRPVVLAPGESQEIEILTRPWGMCAEGSCTQSTAVLEGDFSDLTTGFACGSFATVTDLTIPPSFLWPDAGSNAVFLPPPDPSLGELPFVTQGLPTLPPSPLLFLVPPTPLLIPDGQPPVNGNLFGQPLDLERGRVETVFQLSQPIPPGDPFELVLPFGFVPDPGGQVVSVELLELGVIVGAPTGLDQQQPVFDGVLRVGLDVGGQILFHQVDWLLQLSGLGLDPIGQPLAPIQLQNPQLLPLPPDPELAGFELQLQGVVLQKGSGVSTIIVSQDLRAHGSRGLAIFSDGFESGDTGRWSLASP